MATTNSSCEHCKESTIERLTQKDADNGNLQNIYHWTTDAHDNGWECCCGFKIGRNETLDNVYSVEKIREVMAALQDAYLIDLSDNQTQNVIQCVQNDCKIMNTFSQASILSTCTLKFMCYHSGITEF